MPRNFSMYTRHADRLAAQNLCGPQSGVEAGDEVEAILTNRGSAALCYWLTLQASPLGIGLLSTPGFPTLQLPLRMPAMEEVLVVRIDDSYKKHIDACESRPRSSFTGVSLNIGGSSTH